MVWAIIYHDGKHFHVDSHIKNEYEALRLAKDVAKENHVIVEVVQITKLVKKDGIIVLDKIGYIGESIKTDSEEIPENAI